MLRACFVGGPDSLQLSSKMFKQKTKPRHTGEFNKLVSAHNTEPEVQDKLKVGFSSES